MTNSSVLGLIPARAGSKGVRRKNLRELNDVPLIEYSIRAGLQSTSIDSLVVSTNDKEIAEVSAEKGARVPFLRPPELATDQAPTAPVISHALNILEQKGENYDTLILLQPTSPLRKAKHVDEAFSIYESSIADSVISAYPSYEGRWRFTDEGAEKLNYIDDSKRRQDRAPEYVVNGAVYVTSVDQFLQTEEIVTGYVKIYEMSEQESVDIDTPFDLWIAEKIITEWRK